MTQTLTPPAIFTFANDGAVPNSSLPLLVYRQAVILDADDPAATLEALFAANGWTGMWRNGVLGYQHYHSGAHEVLGVARGSAVLRFGGGAGKDLPLGAGDAAVLPAGTGHGCMECSDDFEVVGAYPPGQALDVIRAEAPINRQVLQRIAELPLPESDPVVGGGGGLVQLWLGPR